LVVWVEVLPLQLTIPLVVVAVDQADQMVLAQMVAQVLLVALQAHALVLAAVVQVEEPTAQTHLQ
jgi:hypothetical protein